ncbi:MAG: dTDP-4-dehydrorhamnose reductase [Enhydrobacter sp.]|nr:dTDP-4-dehydrorhamnose reductase [Enhydrobacter sp.]
MRILLTGVTGQVGGALLPRLSTVGEVIAADRNTLDLANPKHVAGRLDELAPDLIVNPAAYTAVDRAEDERELAYAINGEAPGALAEWAGRRAVPLIHFSTDYVFSGEGSIPWREDDATRPLSVYGASKQAGEAAVRSAGGPHLIVRTSWVYGATGNNFLRTMVRLARERPELRVVADQFGAPTSAALIADAVMSVLGRSQNVVDNFDRAGGVIHLSASGYTSWHEFARAIVSGLRQRGVELTVERVVPITSAEYPTKAQRPLNSRLDLSRLATVFGIVPDTWSDALDRELDRVVAPD